MFCFLTNFCLSPDHIKNVYAYWIQKSFAHPLIIYILKERMGPLCTVNFYITDTHVLLVTLVCVIETRVAKKTWVILYLVAVNKLTLWIIICLLAFLNITFCLLHCQIQSSKFDKYNPVALNSSMKTGGLIISNNCLFSTFCERFLAWFATSEPTWEPALPFVWCEYAVTICQRISWIQNFLILFRNCHWGPSKVYLLCWDHPG